MSKLFFIAFLFLSGCGSMEVRKDPSPSPLDVGYNAALIEGCGHLNSGQVGCSYGFDEQIPDTDEIAVYSPLGGTITLFSRECGIDRRSYHKEGGRFTWKINELFPMRIKFCTLDVLVNWELPADIKTEYPIRGLRGHAYFRRRPDSSAPTQMEWAPQVGITKSYWGIAYAQFRGMTTMPFTEGRAKLASMRDEPILLRVKLNKPVSQGGGMYQLWGCDHGIESARLEPGVSEIEIPRDVILQDPRQGHCTMFGWAIDGEGLQDDITVSYNVFDYTHVHLSADVSFNDDKTKVCYGTENTVSVVVYDGKASNKLQDCFSFNPAGAGIGFFTHQGRAVYAIVTAEKEIKWVQ